MKTLQQLREKYWSNAAYLYPATTSPSKLEVRFDFSQFGVDKVNLLLAQKCFKDSFFISEVCDWCIDCHCDHRFKQANNRANYHLAGAYQIEGKNVDFWNQFL